MKFYITFIFFAVVKTIFSANTTVSKINLIPGTINAYNYVDYYEYSANSTNSTTKSNNVSTNNLGDITYITDGEWLKYNINNNKTTKYEISYTVASNKNIPIDLELFLLIDPTSTSKDHMCDKAVHVGDYTNKNFQSNDWNKYITLKSSNIVDLSAGPHSVVMCIKKGESVNINKINFNEVIDENVNQSADTNSKCFSHIDWSTNKKQITLNNIPFHIKGVNWFGFETSNFNLHGLDKRSMEDLVNWLAINKFNALRIPVTEFNIYNFDKVATLCNPSLNDCTLSTKEVLQKLFKLTAEKGIVILLDMHMLVQDQLTDLWYNDTYNEDSFINAWKILVGLFKDEPNLMAIDLFNEPHGRAEWGGNGPNDWRRLTIKLVEQLYYTYPDFNKLIFVEGLGYSKDFTKYTQNPLDFNYLSTALDKRIVLSQHAYGPSVYSDPAWAAADFPNNLISGFDQFFQIENASGKASVMGEFGGQYTGKDKQWQDKFVDYSIANCIEDNFYWALNAESLDTGGLLKIDYFTPETDKLNLLARLQPNPSKFTQPIINNNICVNYGSYVNEKCNY